jgi:hypothetical protein
VAAVLGMDQDARIALERLLAMAERRRVGVAGRFMKDEGVARLLVERGIVEEVAEEDFFRFQRVAIPYCGVAARDRRAWEEAGVPLEDFTAPQVRRAQVALGLLRMEGASGLVIGRHDDAESLAIARLRGGLPDDPLAAADRLAGGATSFSLPGRAGFFPRHRLSVDGPARGGARAAAACV